MNEDLDKQKAIENEVKNLWAMLPEHTRELFKRIRTEMENQPEKQKPEKEL